MKKRTLIRGVCALAAYVLLLALLVWAESAHPETPIHSLGDALWYSLVTLTTVGYGDLYPVSALGRVIGLVFLLLSIGLLASVLGAAVVFLRSRLDVLSRRHALRGHPCYVFTQENEVARAIADNLLKRDPNSMMVFCGQTENIPSSGRRVWRFPQAAAALLQQLSSHDTPAVFLTSDSVMENYETAKRLLNAHVTLYCRGAETPDLPGVCFFDTDACAARAYWAAHPIAAAEKTVLLVGDGTLAQALLTQALLVNCRSPFMGTAYHVFGDWADYQRFHPALCKALANPAGDMPQDQLIFASGAWNADPALLSTADRIIFCWDDDRRNAETATRLISAFPVSGLVYAASAAVPAPAIAFGAPQETCACEIILQNELDRRAVALHRLYCGRTGDQTPWSALSPFLKASNRASADHLPVKIRLLTQRNASDITPELGREASEIWRSVTDREPYRRNEHERWLRFHLLYNWQYGPEKDSAKRTHPCIVPYDSLSQEEREKDDSAWELLNAIPLNGEDMA